MRNIIPNKRAETFVGCDITTNTPRVIVQVSDLSDFDTPVGADNYVNIVVDVGEDRLRLKVHEDGSWSLDNYKPEDIDPSAWGVKVNVAAGDLHRGSVHSRPADRAVTTRGYER